MQEILCYYGEASGGQRHKAIDPVSVDIVVNGAPSMAIVCRGCAYSREQLKTSTYGTQTATIAAPRFLTPQQMDMLRNLKPQTKSDYVTDMKFQEVIAGEQFNFS